MKITIHTAPTRYNVRWQPELLEWADFARRCTEPRRTAETFAQYVAMDKKAQGDAKDAGGFVGATLRGGFRRTGSVIERTLVTLDYDHPAAAPMERHPVWEAVKELGCAAVIYTTHSHSAEAPRFRVVLPLAHPVEPKEYVAVARGVAAAIGTDGIDETTYEPERMFYWPSAAADGDFFAATVEGPWLDPEAYRTEEATPAAADSRQHGGSPRYDLLGDPRAKGGVIGAFCRAYTVSEAIATFLPDVYRPAGHNRYTYTGGSTVGGLVVYGDLWADSHHDTDPAGGHAINAFDLVRCHLFGGGALKPDISYIKKMTDFVKTDARVAAELGADGHGGSTAPGTAGAAGAAGSAPVRKKRMLPEGHFPNTIAGAVAAIKTLLPGALWYDEFYRKTRVNGGLPWRPDAQIWEDRDNASLRMMLEAHGVEKQRCIFDALDVVLMENRRHPVREYLNSVKDKKYTKGTLERLFVDYLGADDSTYIRAVTRKFFAAAVARIYQPGIKFDFCPVLQGPQGIGKSTLLRIMGGEWFSDSLVSLEGKEAMEQIQGTWINELGELSAVRRSDIEAVKAFISRQEDNFRAAYARNTDTVRRQCVFAATTNKDQYLKEDNNRRFWPVILHREKIERLCAFDRLREKRDELWAEAVAIYESGEKLYLEGDLEMTARRLQAEANVEADNPYVSELEVFAAQLIPTNWEVLTKRQRRQYVQGSDLLADEKMTVRQRICPAEFLYECYGMEPGAFGYRDRARQVAAALKEMGWTPVHMSTHCSKAYGRQRSYERPKAEHKSNLPDDDDDGL